MSSVSVDTLGDLLYVEPPSPQLYEREWRALVGGVAARRHEALLEIYERSHRAVFTLLLRLTCSRELAEHLTVEVYDALTRASTRWPPGDALVLTWLLRRARALALRRLRGDRVAYGGQPGADGDFPFAMPDYRNILRHRELERGVGAALAAMGEAARRMVELTWFESRTWREAADALGLPPAEAAEALRGALFALAGHLHPGVDLPADGCPESERASALAVEALPLDEVDAVRSHVATCSRCARELALLREVTGAFVAWPTELLRPSASVRASVLAGLGAPANLELPAPRAPVWKVVTPAISCSLASVDTDTHDVGMLVRLAPGGVYPSHTHASGEELFLLSGELWIDGHKVFPGEVARARPGTYDHLVWTETGCSCVLVTSSKDVLGSK